MAAGLDPAAFWSLTPRLYLAQMRGAGIRSRREIELEWLGAMLARARKIPPPEQLLRDKHPLSPEELRAELRARSRVLPKKSWKEWRQQ